LKAASDQPQIDNKVESCSPLFRWAGGKRRLIEQIRPLLPAKFNRYYEPFCGGAAVFFALRPEVALLADRNAELINCYRQVKERPERVIAACQKLKNTKTEFYRVRASLPHDPVGAAARLIYLMNYSFNGIYRVNSRGKFNVPYGGKKKREFDVERIRRVSKAFAKVEFVHDDFEKAAAGAKSGDLVYFDPPYTVAHGNNGFIQYNEKIFSWEDQVRLESFARRLAKRGCHVIISNAEHPSLMKLYSDFKRETVRRHSGIGASSNSRKRISEYVFYL
jgi:DNA adenine methylase